MKPKITDIDLCRAAKRVGCTPAEIKTFLEVETKNDGFDDQDRPLILFERHWFHHYTKGIYDSSHPGISNPKAGGYGAGGNHQWDRYAEAAALNEWAAKMSCSWGLGQVMGLNYLVAGFPTLDEFVSAMFESEGRQLDASVSFIVHNHLDDDLRNHSWATFARGYNGAGYAKNEYDTKLAAAYRKHSRNPIDCSALVQINELRNTTGGESVVSPVATPPAGTPNPDPPPPVVATTVPATVGAPVEIKKTDVGLPTRLFTYLGTAFAGISTMAGAWAIDVKGLISNVVTHASNSSPAVTVIGVGAGICLGLAPVATIIYLLVRHLEKRQDAADKRLTQVVDSVVSPNKQSVVIT